MARKTRPLSAAVGLDIGTDMIKVVEAKNGKNGPTITGLGIAPIPEGTIDNNIILDPPAVGQAIKALLSESGIKVKPVISAVAGQSSVVVRVIEVPKMTKEELAETMKFEVERQVPLPLNEVLVDFEQIERPGDGPDPQSMEVLLAVAHQELVNRHIEALFAAGLAPKAIDIEPLATSRALLGTDPEAKNQIAAILDIGSNNTEFGVFENGQLTFACPALQIAGITFTQAISEYLQIPMDEAEDLKRKLAVFDLSKVGGMPPQVEADTFDEYVEQEPQTEPAFDDDQEEYRTPFDLVEETGEPQPADSTPVDDDVYTVGGEQVEQPAKPVFDLDSDMSFESEKPAEPDVELTGSFDLSGDESVDSTEVAPVPVNHSVGMSEQETKDRISEAIGPVLLDLAAELRRFLEYYETKYFSQPAKIFVAGGSAKIKGIDKALESELGIPVEIADPFKNVVMACPRYSEQYLEEIAPLFSVSIGLALRDMLPD